VDEAAHKELQATVASPPGARPGARGALDRPARPLGKEAVGIAVPIVAVAGIFGGPAGVFTALAAFVVIFLVLSLTRR
jgi:hypothetical protein